MAYNKLFASALLFFSLYGASSVEAFSDVTEGAPNYQAISYWDEKAVFVGYEDDSFRPDISMNRAELIKSVISANEIEFAEEDFKDCFLDVSDEWFAPYICYAKDQEWIEGYSDGNFYPANEINRA